MKLILSGQFIPVKSETKSPEGAANLIRKLQLIQQALINQPKTGTEKSQDQETQQREETEVEPPRAGRRRKGKKKKKRRNRVQEARNTLEESGETKFVIKY